MFRNTPAVNTEQVDTQVPAPAEPIPLSVLTLDLAEPPIEGWAAYLAGRGVELTLDDVGRLAVSRSDARMLLTEKREAEARRAEFCGAGLGAPSSRIGCIGRVSLPVFRLAWFLTV